MIYQLWIDSDIVFNTEKFWQLLDMKLSLKKQSLRRQLLKKKDAEGNVILNEDGSPKTKVVGVRQTVDPSKERLLQQVGMLLRMEELLLLLIGWKRMISEPMVGS